MTGKRKARWSRLVSCGHWVLGNQVIHKRGNKWICEPCQLAATLKARDDAAFGVIGAAVSA